MNKVKDLTGQKFGRLLVLGYIREQRKSQVKTIWICKCDCGSEIRVLASNLKRNTSCGCANTPSKDFNNRWRLNKNGCWIWNSRKDADGYGIFMHNYKNVRAHRWALQTKLGRSLLPGMQANHTCDNPLCVNPDHLYEGSQQDNMNDRNHRDRNPLKGLIKNSLRNWKCKRGHPDNELNTWIHPIKGYRGCRECRKVRWRERKSSEQKPVTNDV